MVFCQKNRALVSLVIRHSFTQDFDRDTTILTLTLGVGLPTKIALTQRS
jgi:hypothetical protein